MTPSEPEPKKYFTLGRVKKQKKDLMPTGTGRPLRSLETYYSRTVTLVKMESCRSTSRKGIPKEKCNLVTLCI